MEEKSQRGGHGVLITMLAVILLYVCCPVVFLFPLAKLAKVTGVPKIHQEKVLLPFLPLIYLSDHCKPYERVINAEGELLQKFMGDPFD